MCHQKLTISWFAVVLLASPLMAIWELEKDVYVVEVDWSPGAPGESVALTCDTPEEDDITWTSDQRIDFKESGKTVTFKSKSLYMLLPDSRAVTCGAASLSSEKVRVDEQDFEQYSVSCQEDVACPTAEETLPIELVLDAQEQNKYENYSTSFFIRDIIKPDPPKNVQVKPLKNDEVEVSWEYPDSWSTPHSYFSLKFFVQIQCNKERTKKKRKKTEVEIERKCKQKEPFLVDKTSATVECKGAKVCVQAQDRYYNSSFSKWECVPCK